jgi:Survival motor neuron (SMN) interacting protein 1 (SIP1)
MLLTVPYYPHNPSQNVNQPTIHIHLTPETERRMLMPEKKERDLWWAFLAGKPESDWNPPKMPKQTPKFSKHRRGMRGFADDAGSYEPPQQESFQNDEGEVEKVLRVDPMESLPTPTCSPEPPETSTSMEDQLVGPSSMVSYVSPQRTTGLMPREPMPSLLKHIDQVEAPTAHLRVIFIYLLLENGPSPSHVFRALVQLISPAT